MLFYTKYARVLSGVANSHKPVFWTLINPAKQFLIVLNIGDKSGKMITRHKKH